MGGLLGEPLELVRCETSDVLVPAHAEMVIEAEILPHERIAEGPFGEFTGYSLGERRARGRQGQGHHPSPGRDLPGHHGGPPRPPAAVDDPIEANLYRAVRAMVPDRAGRARARRRSRATCRSSSASPARRKNAILAVLGADLYMKRVVVVDHDVDVFDDRQVNWAIATRCQPDRDITVMTHARGSDLDPSTQRGRLTAKWGVDATAKPSLAGFTPRHRVPPAVCERIDLDSSLLT